MQRLFGQIINNEVTISEDDKHHLLNVKRYKVGEKLEIVISSKIYFCELSSINPFKIQIIKEITNLHEIKGHIHVAFALLKGDHNSLIVEKCTELGAYKFYPFISDRTVIKADLNDDSNRINRLSKIVKGACEQSRRDIVPEVANTSSYKDILSLPFENKLIAYEGIAGSSKTLVSYLEENKNIGDLLVVFGPEGGFSEKEYKQALDNGFIPVSLGKTILRGETACIASTAVIASLMEKNND